MSKEYPCVYYDREKCTLHGKETDYIDWCVMGPCSKETPSNADHIRSMTDEELAEFLEYLYSHCDGPWEILFERKFCDHCPAPEYELEDGRNLKLPECDFTGGKCQHGSDVLWWLKQTYKEDA